MLNQGDRIRGFHAPGFKLQCSSLVVVLCTLSLGVLIAGCNRPASPEDESKEETSIALRVRATTLAMAAEEEAEPVEVAERGEDPEEALPSETPVPSTDTPQPSETPHPTATPSPTETPTITPTPGPEAVEGSLVRAPYDPAADLGSPQVYESFDASEGIFPDRSDGASRSWYGDGLYNLSFTSRGRWTWYWTNMEGANFYADVVIYNGDQCVDRDTAGFVYRGSAVWDYGYMFGISCGGAYFVGLTAIPGSDGFICAIINRTKLDCDYPKLIPHPAIDPGPEAINRIGIMAKGGDVDFYINGEWVDEFSMYSLGPGFTIPQGNFALYLGTAQKPNARVSFDDFSLWFLQ